jgi:hypothetical protein
MKSKNKPNKKWILLSEILLLIVSNPNIYSKQLADALQEFIDEVEK